MKLTRCITFSFVLWEPDDAQRLQPRKTNKHANSGMRVFYCCF